MRILGKFYPPTQDSGRNLAGNLSLLHSFVIVSYTPFFFLVFNLLVVTTIPTIGKCRKSLGHFFFETKDVDFLTTFFVRSFLSLFPFSLKLRIQR